MSADSPVVWGNCDDCDARIYVARDEPLSDNEEWDNGGIFSSCYVCGGQVLWGGSDPEREVLR